jgi:formylglycine-generating enzyme required for sulfatase activity
VAQYKNFIDATGYKTSAEIDGWSYALQGGILLRKNGVDWRCGVDGEVLQKSEMNRPVTHVSYNDAVSFCVWLNQQTGKNYRLPTEAEWEYAAKGGKRGSGFMFSGGPDPMAVGWLSQNSGHETHPVGQKPPNRLGLCDMTGNVWEWCGDWFGRYDEGQAVDPEGPATGAYRVVRGGSWYNDPQSSRVSSRNHLKPSGRSANIGFRVVSDL